jgi:hypothetical protein
MFSSMAKGMASKAQTAVMAHPMTQQLTTSAAGLQNQMVAASGITCNCDVVDPVKDNAEFAKQSNAPWVGWKGANTGPNGITDPNNKNFADGIFSLISRYNSVCGKDKKVCGQRWARTLRAIAKNESRLGVYGDLGIKTGMSNFGTNVGNLFKSPQQQAQTKGGIKRKHNKNHTQRKNSAKKSRRNSRK